ncbi:MAG TPA: carbohydrate ABC transporter permease [Bacillota bacterium]
MITVSPGRKPRRFLIRKFGRLVFEGIMWILALLFLFPTLVTILNSVKTDAQIVLNPFSLPTALNFNNYAAAWKGTSFPWVFGNTLLITVLSTLGIILTSSMAAYILARSCSKLAWYLYLIFTFSMIVPFQTFMVPLVQLAREHQLQNCWGIIPIYIGLGCPLAIFMYHGFIKGIPLEIEESAALDGASVGRLFFTVVFPLLTPATATIAILDVLWIWNDFLLPLIILPKGSTLQLAQFGFFGMYRQQYSLAMASLVLTAAPVVLFYLVMQSFIIKGITAGAVKG